MMLNAEDCNDRDTVSKGTVQELSFGYKPTMPTLSKKTNNQKKKKETTQKTTTQNNNNKKNKPKPQQHKIYNLLNHIWKIQQKPQVLG